jgi:hypothetical protein
MLRLLQKSPVLTYTLANLSVTSEVEAAKLKSEEHEVN